MHLLKTQFHRVYSWLNSFYGLLKGICTLLHWPRRPSTSGRTLKERLSFHAESKEHGSERSEGLTSFSICLRSMFIIFCIAWFCCVKAWPGSGDEVAIGPCEINWLKAAFEIISSGLVKSYTCYTINEIIHPSQLCCVRYICSVKNQPAHLILIPWNLSGTWYFVWSSWFGRNFVFSLVHVHKSVFVKACLRCQSVRESLIRVFSSETRETHIDAEDWRYRGEDRTLFVRLSKCVGPSQTFICCAGLLSIINRAFLLLWVFNPCQMRCLAPKNFET